MTDCDTHLNDVIDAIGRLGIDVRSEHLGGGGGGLCSLKGRRVVFVDLDADLATQTQRCLDALSLLPEADECYLAPAIREAIEQRRAEGA